MALQKSSKQITFMRLLIIKLTFLFLPCICLSQASSNNHKKFRLNPWENINGYRLAGGYNDDIELEVSYLFTSYPATEPGFGAMLMRVQYIGFGLEYLRIGNKNVFGTKLSYENSFAIFSGQIATDFLFTDDSIQIRILPKIGLSIFGFVTIYYGWNYHLLKESDLITQDHIISLQINILR